VGPELNTPGIAGLQFRINRGAPGAYFRKRLCRVINLDAKMLQPDGPRTGMGFFRAPGENLKELAGGNKHMHRSKPRTRWILHTEGFLQAQYITVKGGCFLNIPGPYSQMA
jgi:hypothetical protein